MRQIEKQMLLAIYNKKNWKSANTEVICTDFQHADEPIERCTVLLHGSPVAVVTPKHVTICDCGYQTTTTKSRINAVLGEFCPGAGVYQASHKWYLSAQDDEPRLMEPQSQWVIDRGEYEQA